MDIYWGNATNAQPPLPGVSWEWEIWQVQVPTATVLAIKVTDGGIVGDSFELWSVNDAIAPTAGSKLGATPAVAQTGFNVGWNYDANYLDPTVSHGRFYFYVTNGGTYNFTVRVVDFATGYTEGNAGIEFDDVTPSPVGGYVIPSNAASVLTSLLLPFALLGAIGLAVAYRKKFGF